MDLTEITLPTQNLLALGVDVTMSEQESEQTFNWDNNYDFQLYSDSCPSPNIHEYKRGQVSTRYSTTIDDLSQSLASFNISQTTTKLDFESHSPPEK